MTGPVAATTAKTASAAGNSSDTLIEDAPIRLIHLTTIPGSLWFLRGQARQLQQWGFEVHALSSPGDALELFAAHERVKTYAVSMQRRISPVRDLVALARIGCVLRSVRPQIVHTHTLKASLLGMLAGWLTRVPVRIYHMHGLRFVTSTRVRRWLLRLSERICCLLAHRVLCVSHSVRDVAVNEGICPAQKIRVLLGGSVNGIDVERFQPADSTTRAAARAEYGIPSDAFVIGFLGRVVRDKGIVELASAWRALRETFADLRLLIVGPVESQDRVPAQVLETLRSDPRVTMRGLDWNTAQLYAAMDLFALPTYREGLPTTLLEASAMGLPIVATRIPGCLDVVEDQITGVLVPPGDIAALGEAIARYRRDGQLRQRHGRAARGRVVRHFQQEAIWSATCAEYLALLTARGLKASRWMATPSESHRGKL